MSAIRFSKLSTAILLGMVAVGFLNSAAFGVVLYQRLTTQAYHELVQVSEALLRPIIIRSSRGVNGGNLMKLRGNDAEELYEGSGVLYLRMEGTSQGSPKTAFAAALPPQLLSHSYTAKGLDERALSATAQRLAHQEVDHTQGLLVLKHDLNVKNGGRIVAVFSASSLASVARDTLFSVAVIGAIVFVLTLAVALFIGRSISSPITKASREIKEISETLDLTATVHVHTRNEIADMATAFNGLLAKVREILGNVGETANHLHRQAVVVGKVADQTNDRMRAGDITELGDEQPNHAQAMDRH